jgi:hypothetical protein
MRYWAVLFCLTLVGCSGNSTPKEQPDAPNPPAKEEAKKEEPPIDALTLWQDVKANPPVADLLKYKGKRLQVRISRIARIDKSKVRPGEWGVAAPIKDSDKDDKYEGGAIIFFFTDPKDMTSLKVGSAPLVIAGDYLDFDDNRYVRLTACKVK